MLLEGNANKVETKYFLEQQFKKWSYQSNWLRFVPSLELYSSVFGIEFSSVNFEDLNLNFPQLLDMGCNHFQWFINEPNDFKLVENSSFLTLLKDDTFFASRANIILSLRLSEACSEHLEEVIFEAKTKLCIDQWDYISLPYTSFSSQHSYEFFSNIKVFLDFQGVDIDQFNNSFQFPEFVVSAQIPFNLIEFKEFLKKKWKARGDLVSLPRLINYQNLGISFYSPFDLSHSSNEQDLLCETTSSITNYTQIILTQIQQLEEIENEILKLLEKSENPFEFVKPLADQIKKKQTKNDWEYYLANKWNPMFQKKIFELKTEITEEIKEDYSKLLDMFLQRLADLVGTYSEQLQSIQSQKMSSFLKIIDQSIPQNLLSFSFGAKTLMTVCSTPWPNTILFPWTNLESSVEYLGLMRFPKIKDTGQTLKNISKLENPHISPDPSKDILIQSFLKSK